MKKSIYLLLLVLVLLFPYQAFALVGTCVETKTALYVERDYSVPIEGPSVIKVAFVCTASADNATFPSTTVSDATTISIVGRKLDAVTIQNGAIPPTPLYSVVINDVSGVDVLGNAGMCITGVANVGVQLAPWGYMSKRPMIRPIGGAVTLVITGNLVNSAVTTVTMFFVK